MNKLMGIFLLGTALSLTACGGDSDSSGSNTPAIPTTPATPTKPTTPTKPNNGDACVSNGNEVLVTTKGCNYSNSSMNNGASIKYTCMDGRVSNGSITAKTINLNGITIKCAS